MIGAPIRLGDIAAPGGPALSGATLGPINLGTGPFTVGGSGSELLVHVGAGVLVGLVLGAFLWRR